MKKLTTFALLLFTAFTIVAQTGGLMEQYDIISGKNYKNNGSILAKEYAFEDKIDQFYLDTTTNTVTLQLLEKNKTWNFMNMPGRIVLFDLKTNSIRWDKKLIQYLFVLAFIVIGIVVGLHVIHMQKICAKI